jgi:hypothetical protein
MTMKRGRSLAYFSAYGVEPGDDGVARMTGREDDGS